MRFTGRPWVAGGAVECMGIRVLDGFDETLCAAFGCFGPALGRRAFGVHCRIVTGSGPQGSHTAMDRAPVILMRGGCAKGP